MTNTTNTKITREEYDLMWYDFKEGNITEAQWREFCDARYHADVAKDVMVRLKNR